MAVAVYARPIAKVQNSNQLHMGLQMRDAETGQLRHAAAFGSLAVLLVTRVSGLQSANLRDVLVGLAFRRPGWRSTGRRYGAVRRGLHCIAMWTDKLASAVVSAPMDRGMWVARRD